MHCSPYMTLAVEPSGVQIGVQNCEQRADQLATFRVAGLSLPTVQAACAHKYTCVYTCVQDAVGSARETWSASLDASLAACNWPPPPAAEPDPGAAAAWRGFPEADPATVTAAETAFCGLLALQEAAGSPSEPDPPADGPWAAPELWAIRALASPQLRALEATFFDPSGGPLADLDASEYLFQGATLSMETAVAELSGFQGHLGDAVTVGAALARSLHAGTCELLLQGRLPEFGALGGEAAMHLWVAVADASHAWELTVRF